MQTIEVKNFWQSKKVFITGATGLVGHWLTRKLLEEGAFPVILMRDFDPQSELIRSELYKQTTVVNGALEDFASLERAVNEHEIDTVFHLGAQTIVGTAYRNPLPTFEANIRGSYNLLEVCRIHSSLVKRIVIASSDKAYGSSKVLPYTEEMPLVGSHPYDVSKSCTDLLASTYHHTYSLPISIARCGNIYGGGDLNWSRLIPGTIRSLLREESPILRSDGLFTRDYIYVEDVVGAYLKLAESDVRGEAFNFGPMQPYTALEIVEKISHLMNKNHLAPIILNQAKAEIKDQYLTSEKARKMLNWESSFSLEEGLKETIHWYHGYLDKSYKGSVDRYFAGYTVKDLNFVHNE